MTETVTGAELRKLMSKGKRSKYGNQKTRGYDSAKEARRADDLALLEKAGEISKLRRQVPISLSVEGEHIGAIVFDFVYQRDGRTVYEDVKSPATITPLFRWKAKHFRAQYGHEVEIFQ